MNIDLVLSVFHSLDLEYLECVQFFPLIICVFKVSLKILVRAYRLKLSILFGTKAYFKFLKFSFEKEKLDKLSGFAQLAAEHFSMVNFSHSIESLE